MSDEQIVDGTVGPITLTTMQVHLETQWWTPTQLRQEIVRLRVEAMQYNALRDAVRRYVASWEGLAMGDCAYPEELEEMVSRG